MSSTDAHIAGAMLLGIFGLAWLVNWLFDREDRYMGDDE